MGRKIAVVGASPAGFVQLSSLVKGRDSFARYTDDEYVLIHDPDKVYNYFMSGTNPAYFDEMQLITTLNRRLLAKNASATDSHGYKYVGWGNRRDKNFFATFKFQVAQHLDLVQFRQMFLDDGGQAFGEGVRIIEQKIDSFSLNDDHVNINGEKYDFVIDCTDKEPLIEPGNYGFPKFETVNTGLIVEIPRAGNWDYTIEYAGKYGHITGIPLKDRQHWIYFFDRKEADENQIFEDFANIFPDEDLRSYVWDKIEWNPCISSYVLHESGLYARNGRALVNVDPLTSTHNELTQIMANLLDLWIFMPEDEDDEEVRQAIKADYGDTIQLDYLGLLAFMYQYGSQHDTPFWQRVTESAVKYLESGDFLHPAYFPGKKWRNEVLSEEWGDKEYRKMLLGGVQIQEENFSGRMRSLPLVLMNNYPVFTELAVGLGAPYAEHLQSFEIVLPPEPFGTIGYERY